MEMTSRVKQMERATLICALKHYIRCIKDMKTPDQNALAMALMTLAKIEGCSELHYSKFKAREIK